MNFYSFTVEDINSNAKAIYIQLGTLGGAMVLGDLKC